MNEIPEFEDVFEPMGTLLNQWGREPMGTLLNWLKLFNIFYFILLIKFQPI